MSADISAKDVSSVADAPKLWQEIVDASPDAWLWHTWTGFQFNLCAGQKYDAKDCSFFVYQNGEPVGLVPLVIEKKTLGNFEGLEASYYSGFLPWPCFKKEKTGEERDSLEDFAFEELQRRAYAAGAGHIRIRLTPPQDNGDEAQRIERVTLMHHYIHSRLEPHMVMISPHTLNDVRERYQRYYKKFSPLFDLTIAEDASMTPELEETYFQLHIKDAGGQFRSRESYTKQADTARVGEGFYVVATEKSSGTVAGMLLISLYHDAALDNSVAIDPNFAEMRVGHLLKWRAIEELQSRNIKTYEVGHQKINIPTLQKLVSKKDQSIAHFKEGWGRGNQRTIWEIEKFLNQEFLHAYIKEREAALREYFELS